MAMHELSDRGVAIGGVGGDTAVKPHDSLPKLDRGVAVEGVRGVMAKEVAAVKPPDLLPKFDIFVGRRSESVVGDMNVAVIFGMLRVSAVTALWQIKSGIYPT
jgi:hypothetical protein